MTTPLPTLTELLHWPPGQQPYAKQEEAHQISSAERLFCLFMMQRTGKTIVTLGTAVYQFQRFLEAGGFGAQPTPSGKRSPAQPEGVRDFLPRKFLEGRIRDLPKKPAKPGFIYRPPTWAQRGMDALLVIAMPSGVPANWSAEIDARVPPWCQARTFVWNSQKMDQVATARDFEALLCHQGLACLLINGEAIPTEAAKKAIGTFLRTRRALAVGDETSLICSQPGNVRSRVMDAIKNLPGAIMRRILDGTPGDESPMDMYAQVNFLDVKILGFDSWVAFKKYYAEWEEQIVYVKGKERKFQGIAVDEKTGRKRFRNLDEMGRLLAPISFRIQRSDVFDIPAKIRVPYRFDLSAAQRAVYDPLRDEFEAWLDDGRHVTAKHALARMTRLDQVSANYWPSTVVPTICGECEGDGCPACNDVGALLSKTAKKIIDPARNSRIDALGDIIAINKQAPGIAWCVFDETVDAVMALATKLNLTPLRYDGSVDPEQKVANVKAYQGGHSGLLVSKEASGGRGLNLSRAQWMAYVENGYSKRKRSQSEDRAEVAGRTFGTGVYDLIANDTYDDKKLEAHFAKGEVSNTLWSAIAEGKKQ